MSDILAYEYVRKHFSDDIAKTVSDLYTHTHIAIKSINSEKKKDKLMLKIKVY